MAASSACRRVVCCLLGLLFAASASRAEDLQRLASPEAFVAIHSRRNPERDYQREHYARVWRTVQEERLPERLLEFVVARISPDKRAHAEQVLAEVKEAFAPIDWAGLSEWQEAIFAQSMGFPFQEQLFGVRLKAESAAGLAQAFENLCEVVSQRSGGEVSVKISQVAGFKLVTLELPLEIQKGNVLKPTCALRDDLFLVASSPDVLRAALGRLESAADKSKFDDPRVQALLAKLPTPEDSLSVFDAKMYFQQLEKLPAMVREQAGGDANAHKAGEIMQRVFEQLNIVDLIVTVEFTEGQQNRSVARGKLQANVDQRVLYKMFAAGAPFEDWRRWVPAETQGFSLTTGASLQPLYAWTTTSLREISPEAAQGLDRWEAIQQEAGVQLDRDILQSFSGEMASVSLARSEGESGGGGNIVFLRCHQPERIRELLHQGVERLNELPPLAAQQLEWRPVEDLEGFERLSIPALAGFGVRPLIGFVDGWLVIGSSRAGLDAVLATREGKRPSFADSDRFARFKVAVEGPVNAISYTETARQNRETAQFLRQAGIIAPGVLAMAPKGPAAGPAESAVQLLTFLPSAAKVLEQFDFCEGTLSVTQPTKDAGEWTTTSVTLVRPVDKQDSDTKVPQADQ
ncbi:MAG: hypothetical protein U0836_06680 [Pirellulales bacterium]